MSYYSKFKFDDASFCIDYIQIFWCKINLCRHKIHIYLKIIIINLKEAKYAEMQKWINATSKVNLSHVTFIFTKLLYIISVTVITLLQSCFSCITQYACKCLNIAKVFKNSF